MDCTKDDERLQAVKMEEYSATVDDEHPIGVSSLAEMLNREYVTLELAIVIFIDTSTLAEVIGFEIGGLKI